MTAATATIPARAAAGMAAEAARIFTVLSQAEPGEEPHADAVRPAGRLRRRAEEAGVPEPLQAAGDRLADGVRAGGDSERSGGMPPDDRDVCQAALDELPGDAFDGASDRFLDLLRGDDEEARMAGDVDAHPDEFFLPTGARP